MASKGRIRLFDRLIANNNDQSGSEQNWGLIPITAISRKLYPNVDFYSGLIYRAMKLPASMFTVMFAVPRTCGWVAQWQELLTDSEQKISRPRQIYTGPDVRDYVPMGNR